MRNKQDPSRCKLLGYLGRFPCKMVLVWKEGSLSLKMHCQRREYDVWVDLSALNSLPSFVAFSEEK